MFQRYVRKESPSEYLGVYYQHLIKVAQKLLSDPNRSPQKKKAVEEIKTILCEQDILPGEQLCQKLSEKEEPFIKAGIFEGILTHSVKDFFYGALRWVSQKAFYEEHVRSLLGMGSENDVLIVVDYYKENPNAIVLHLRASNQLQFVKYNFGDEFEMGGVGREGNYYVQFLFQPSAFDRYFLGKSPIWSRAYQERLPSWWEIAAEQEKKQEAKLGTDVLSTAMPATATATATTATTAATTATATATTAIAGNKDKSSIGKMFDSRGGNTVTSPSDPVVASTTSRSAPAKTAR